MPADTSQELKLAFFMNPFGSLFQDIIHGPADKGMGAWFNEWIANPQHFTDDANENRAKQGYGPYPESDAVKEPIRIPPDAQLNTSIYEEAEVVYE